MALTLPPTRNKQPTEAEIEAVIAKGGSPVNDTEPDDEIKHVNTRLTAGIIRQIDELRASRPRRLGSPKPGISLRDWIVEAVLEKLERDRKSR